MKKNFDFDKNKISPLTICSIGSFPFIEQDFDAVVNYEIISKMAKKINEMILFMNNKIDDRLKEYIDTRFNDIMLDTMYEEETETLVLFLRKEE